MLSPLRLIIHYPLMSHAGTDHLSGFCGCAGVLRQPGLPKFFREETGRLREGMRLRDGRQTTGRTYRKVNRQVTR